MSEVVVVAEIGIAEGKREEALAALRDALRGDAREGRGLPPLRAAARPRRREPRLHDREVGVGGAAAGSTATPTTSRRSAGAARLPAPEGDGAPAGELRRRGEGDALGRRLAGAGLAPDSFFGAEEFAFEDVVLAAARGFQVRRFHRPLLWVWPTSQGRRSGWLPWSSVRLLLPPPGNPVRSRMASSKASWRRGIRCRVWCPAGGCLRGRALSNRLAGYPALRCRFRS